MSSSTGRNWKWLLWVTALVAFTADQSTKIWIRGNLDMYESIVPFQGFPWNQFALTRAYNTGAAFGMLSDYGMFFVIVAIVVIAGIALYYRRLPQEQWWLFLSLGLQLGGAAGNLADRLHLGHVTDFIQISIFPIFNLADVAIVSGVCILAAHFWREDKQEQAQEQATHPVDDSPWIAERQSDVSASWPTDGGAPPGNE